MSCGAAAHAWSNNDRRDKAGQRKTTNDCFSVTLGVCKRAKITERDCWIVESYNTNDESTEVTEQRLADQVLQIKHKKWLETLEKEK